MARNAKAAAPKRAGKAGISGAVKRGGGSVQTVSAGAEDPARSVGGKSHVPAHDVAARKAVKAVVAALKGLTGLDSGEQELIAAAVREADGL